MRRNPRRPKAITQRDGLRGPPRLSWICRRRSAAPRSRSENESIYVYIMYT